MNMNDDIAKIIVDRNEIQKTVKKLGERISEDYSGKDLLLVGVLKGAVVFMADLIREITIPLDMDFMLVSSYGDSTESSGVVKILKDIDTNIKGRHVIIVEDLVDTGLTLTYLKKLLETRGPSTLSICTIFDKPSRKKVDIDIKYKGIEIPDEFVVGYGLDYAGRYRNLPDLCSLKPEVYERR
jgi:hypoxanthine phosphoribosyltransferase